MPEDRASRDGLLYLKEEELRSVLRNVPISDVYCVEDTVFARGKFATVRRALHKTTGVQYAAKYIKKRRRNVNMVPEIYHEISVLLKCASNNRVVRLYEVYETNSDMVLILGLAAGGELQRILDGDQCLGEIEGRRAMRQILEGLCFLHERNIAHLDLKPQNILLMVEDSCDDIKLCDFGISRLLEPGTEVRTLSGTPDYVAPEIVSYEPISLATDIWSVGVLVYVLLSGYTPFGADTKEQTSLNISKGIVTFEPEDFVDVSSVALDFIKSILVLNPKQRPTVQELLQHPWINPQSHILPTLSLKTSSDTINVTPKSTPINQRKSLPCPPETPPTRTTFKSDNMNENGTIANGVENYEVTSLENVNGNNYHDEIQNDNNKESGSLDNNHDEIQNDKNKENGSLDNNYDEIQNDNNKENGSLDRQEETIINRPRTLEYCSNTPLKVESEVVTPNDVLSEVSSEEIEENFYLLTNVKFASNEDLYPSIPSNSEFNDEKEIDAEPSEEPEVKAHIIASGFDKYLTNDGAMYLYKSNEELYSSIASNSDFIENKENHAEVSKEPEEKTHIITSSFDEYLTNEDTNNLYKSNEDLLSDSGIVGSVEFEIDQTRLNEMNYDIDECPDKNDNYLCKLTQEHREEISEIKINFGVTDTTCLCSDNVLLEEQETYGNSSQKTFINTLEVNKEMIYPLDCAAMSENNERSILEESILINSSKITQSFCLNQNLTPIEILANNEGESAEEIEYSNGRNKTFINTFQMNNDDSGV